jgi:chemotaxis methyl-accepting protein methylase
MKEPLAEIAALIKGEAGIVITGSQLGRLEAIVAKLAPGISPGRFLEELADPGTDGIRLALLIDAVTVKETYFFREPRELMSVDWKALLQTARADGGEEVRVWVPACASGEEPYTLAMLALQAFGAAEPPVSILATDIATSAIESSRAGLYSPRSVRNVPRALRARHFADEGHQHRLLEPVKSMVRFSLHNLVNDSSPPQGQGRFDLIACRNLLIYFDKPTAQRVVASLAAALRPGGELIMGAADRLTGTTASLQAASARRGAERHGAPADPGRRLRRPLGLPELNAAGAEVTASLTADRPARRNAERVEAAMRAADAGELERAIKIATEVLDADPLDADACYVRGIAELGLDDADAAVASLRRSLYIDPCFGLAAFGLGRAHDAGGDQQAAQRAYRLALRTLDGNGDAPRAITENVDLGDVAAACRLRLDSGGGVSAR